MKLFRGSGRLAVEECVVNPKMECHAMALKVDKNNVGETVQTQLEVAPKQAAAFVIQLVPMLVFCSGNAGSKCSRVFFFVWGTQEYLFFVSNTSSVQTSLSQGRRLLWARAVLFFSPERHQILFCTKPFESANF